MNRGAAIPVALGWAALALCGTSRLGAQSREADTEALIRAYMKEQAVPGIAVAISKGGELIYTAALGYADLEMMAPVTASTLFRTASVLKPMTATAVLLLAHEGALDLDLPIQTYCPAYPEKRWRVTARLLIGHAGGVHGSALADLFNREHFAAVGEVVARFALDSLVAEPGTRTVYSNAGYTLLACAIEGASGTTYDAYLQARVFGPAGMSHTRRDNVLEVIPGRARGYMVRTEANTALWQGLWRPWHLSDTPLDVPFNADPVDPSWSLGAGGYLTTPVDLVRFASALLAGRLLPPDLVARLTEPCRLSDGQTTGRANGWVLDEFEGVTILQVLGSGWNGSSGLWVRPADTLAIAVSTNKGLEQPSRLVEALGHLWK